MKIQGLLVAKHCLCGISRKDSTDRTRQQKTQIYVWVFCSYIKSIIEKIQDKIRLTLIQNLVYQTLWYMGTIKISSTHQKLISNLSSGELKRLLKQLHPLL